MKDLKGYNSDEERGQLKEKVDILPDN